MIQVEKGTSGKVVCGAASILSLPVTQHTRGWLCQVKSSQVKSSQVKILAAVWGLALLSATAQAQVTTTETLNFDNNQMPSGWSFFGGTPPTPNIQITNQRLEVGQVDNYGGISRSIDTTGVTKIRVEYDGNIANVYWGQGNEAMLVNSMTSLNAQIPTDSAYIGMKKSGYGENSMIFYSHYNLNNTSTFTYQNVVSPAAFGDYRISTIFENEQFTQTATNLATGATFSSGTTLAPGFLLSSMNTVALFGWTTTGVPSWIDNASISITTAVPEPESYALLLAGLGVLGAVSRRSRRQGFKQLG